MDEPLFLTILIIVETIFSFEILRRLKQAGASSKVISVIAIVMLLWLSTIIFLLENNFFSSTQYPQISFTLGVVIPTMIGLAFIQFFRPIKQTISSLTTKDLIYLQYWRAAFGVLFFFTSHLPLWFKYVGGLGDIAAGLAPFLAMQFFLSRNKNRSIEKQALFFGNIVGILDFIVVLNLGVGVVLQTMSPDIAFNLIPLYVVPMFILLHIISYQRWRQL